jgi:hypothetical protein
MPARGESRHKSSKGSRHDVLQAQGARRTSRFGAGNADGRLQLRRNRASAAGGTRGERIAHRPGGLTEIPQRGNRSPPAKVADIEPVEPLFQAAYLGLIRNDIVYVWGASIDPAAGDKVLAYEKGVESSSGWVLMQDGSVETMQASAFQAAPKATK